MRNLFLLLFCLFSIIGVGQPNDTVPQKQTRTRVIFDDSAMIRLERFRDSVSKAQEMEEFNKTNQKNLNYFLQLQKERRAKQKREAILRIAIGIGFLIILIIGFRRRAKKAGNKNSV